MIILYFCYKQNAIISYHALDQCFSNPRKRYFIDDLIEVCNDNIYEFTGASNEVKKKQIFEDIKFMESEQGWFVPIERSNNLILSFFISYVFI